MNRDDLIWTGDRFVKRQTLHSKHKPPAKKENKKYQDKWGAPLRKVSQEYMSNPQSFKGYGNR